MSPMTSQITSLTIVFPTGYSGADQRKHPRHWPLCVCVIPRGPVNSPHKWPVTRKNASIWWRHHENLYDTTGFRQKSHETYSTALRVLWVYKFTYILNYLLSYVISYRDRSSSWRHNNFDCIYQAPIFFIYFLFVIKTYLPRIHVTHEPKAVSHEVLLHTTYLCSTLCNS